MYVCIHTSYLLINSLFTYLPNYVSSIPVVFSGAQGSSKTFLPTRLLTNLLTYFLPMPPWKLIMFQLIVSFPRCCFLVQAVSIKV